MAVIPFSVSEAAAKARIGAWLRRRLAAPRDLAAAAEAGRTAGLYAPFWTFDSREAVAYWASYVTGRGNNRRRRTTSGTMNVTFDDLLVPASPHVTALIRDGILHDFSPSRLRPYRPGYLAGFAAEQHHQTVAEGLRANAADKDLLLRNRIKRKIGKRGTKVTSYRTETQGIAYPRIRLPVWILHYRDAGRPLKVVVSGIDGRTFGERPFSRWKLASYSGAMTALIVALGLVWGAWGAP